MSTIFTGKVVDGRVVVEGTELPEGAEVFVLLRQDGEIVLNREEEAELEAAIDEMEANPEACISGEELLRRLRSGE